MNHEMDIDVTKSTCTVRVGYYVFTWLHAHKNHLVISIN